MTSRLPLALPVLAAAALAAGGCGSTNSNAQSPATTAAAPPASAPASTSTPATSTAASSGNGPIAVTLNEWSVAAAATTAKAGAVTFDVKNAGAQPHEMVVLKTSKPAATLAKAGTARLPETGHVGEVAEMKAGLSGKTTIKLKPGHYVLICNLPGHWTAGMHTDLTVN
jgi:uncharacterized cupredoxin-like copper-binding protein